MGGTSIRRLPQPPVQDRIHSLPDHPPVPRREHTSSSSSSSTSTSSYSSRVAMSQTLLSTNETSLEHSMLGLSLTASPAPSVHQQQMYSCNSNFSSPSASPPPAAASGNGNGNRNGNALTSLTAELPTIGVLQQALPLVIAPSSPLDSQIGWIRDVLYLVNRACAPSPSSSSTSADSIVGPAVIEEPSLAELADTAVRLLVAITPNVPCSSSAEREREREREKDGKEKEKRPKLSPAEAEALFHRAVLTNSGAFPTIIPQNLRLAFRTFEAAARAGHHAAWFRLGRDYEAFDDTKRAKSIFERGAKAGDVSCLYRLGMAHLMGQLSLPVSHRDAIRLLHRAAQFSSLIVPQPAYVYALLMLDDFAHVNASIKRELFEEYVPMGSSIEAEAQKYLEKAAYLHFAPAQYKLGHSYEFARPPFPYDPLLSVQYYTLASSAGEPEADLALSKWFLCGAEGVFEKDESLAFVFADRAARTGLASAEFAMGYYWEVGIGTGKGVDLRKARRWYERAAKQGNQDANDRLQTLTLTPSASISRKDHSRLAEQTLVRRRTQAKQRSDAASASGSMRRRAGAAQREDADRVVGVARRASQMRPRRSQINSRRESAGDGCGSSSSSRRQSRTATSTPTSQSQSSDARLQPASAPALEDSTASTPYSLPPLAFGAENNDTFSLTLLSSTSSATSSTSSDPAPYQNQSQSRLREHKRYSLVDPGAASSSPLRHELGSGSSDSISGLNPAVEVDEAGAGRETSQAQRRGKGRRVKYNTFEEMGIKAAAKQTKEEKDCIIM